MATRRNANGAGEASVPPAPSASARETLDASVARLSGLNTDQLRLQWRNHLGGVAPAHLPGWLLLRVLAYRIQAAAFGDLDRAILRRLHEHRDEAFECPSTPCQSLVGLVPFGRPQRRGAVNVVSLGMRPPNFR